MNELSQLPCLSSALDRPSTVLFQYLWPCNALSQVSPALRYCTAHCLCLRPGYLCPRPPLLYPFSPCFHVVALLFFVVPVTIWSKTHLPFTFLLRIKLHVSFNARFLVSRIVPAYSSVWQRSGWMDETVWWWDEKDGEVSLLKRFQGQRITSDTPSPVVQFITVTALCSGRRVDKNTPTSQYSGHVMGTVPAHSKHSTVAAQYLIWNS